MAVQRIRVTPSSNLTAVFGSIADDGQDYVVTFEPGAYYLPANTTVYRPSGGKLVLRALRYGDVSWPAVVTQRSLNLYSLDTEVLGWRIEGEPWSEDPTDGTDGGLALNVGSIYSPTMRIEHVEKIRLHGLEIFGDQPRVTMFPSMHPAAYTDVLVDGCRVEQAGRFGALVCRNPFISERQNVGRDSRRNYAHIRLNNHRGHGINGPDIATYHHNNGTISDIETSELAGHSTYLATQCEFLSEIYGSNQHDMHCSRVNYILDSDVRYTYRDCKFKGIWRQGRAGILWLWYYHSGAPAGVAPRFDFENCLFQSQFESPLQLSDFYQDSCNPYLAGAFCDGDYHFWDCDFRLTTKNPALWLDEDAAPSAKVVPKAVKCGNSPIDMQIYMHNCTLGPGLARFTNLGDPGFTATGDIYEDTETRGYKAPEWARKSVPTQTPVSQPPDRILDGSFETAASKSPWTYIDDAQRSSAEAYSGTISGALIANIGAVTEHAAISQFISDVNCLSSETLWLGWMGHAEDVIGESDPTSLLVKYRYNGTGSWQTLVEISSIANLYPKTGWNYFEYPIPSPHGYGSIELMFETNIYAPPPTLRADRIYLDVVSLRKEAAYAE